MRWKDKWKQFNKMYEDVGYHNRFIALFVLIIGTVVIEIITIPFIVEEILDVEIPQHNLQGLAIFVGIYIFILAIQCYMVLEHCKMRCHLSRWIRRDLRKQSFLMKMSQVLFCNFYKMIPKMQENYFPLHQQKCLLWA